ncbi:serine/threonine-protein kinase [Ordospora pajunii]|uniref:serine/threonine-protein kinase n=1 Tax=Ordospora pajunii TaxID=3039483 RepID=UPI0029527836|nr:serine/threonine-protein kinase [Ordospora pajunii]KAH9412228.1 serine/threonine-protein kinase [Ordospora pajunii]
MDDAVAVKINTDEIIDFGDFCVKTLENVILMERINMIGDCMEAIHHEAANRGTAASLDRLREMIGVKTKPCEYEIVKNIAKGGYGEVFLVRREKVYAMKRVAKELVLKQPHTALFMAEREVMVGSIGSEWLVSAHLTMQDGEYLYYLMDFVPGGDFMGLLSKEDVLEESWIRFYAAEIVQALDELHKLGWIHRDLKPDNILIAADGHVKLADFGSCIRMVDGKARSAITVGTPDYVSPDVLCSVNEECEYGEDVDFWTLGVIIYEMVYGTTPFYSETLMETYRRIAKVELGFPFKVSAELTDLITRLVTTKEQRLRVEEIRKHPFFNGVDWERVKELVPPFIPEIKDDLDTSHFVDTHFDAEKGGGEEKGNYVPFVGFTFDPLFAQRFRDVLRSEITADEETRYREELKSKGAEYEQNLQMLSIEMRESSKRLNVRNGELQEVEAKLMDAKMLLKEAEDGALKHQEELKGVLMQLLTEREELDEMRAELERCKKSLKSINEDICDGRMISEELLLAESKSGIGKQEMDEIRRSWQAMKNESSGIESLVADVEIMVGKLWMKSKWMKSEVEMYKEKYGNAVEMMIRVEAESKMMAEKLKAEGLEGLRRQLRFRIAEVKEYEQKLNQEILFRKSVEEELSFLKKEKSRERRTNARQQFSCSVVGGDGSTVTIRIENDKFWIGDESQHGCNVYVGELRPNELHHLAQKKVSLTLKIVFMNEEVKSVSSSGRRSLRSLEEDLSTEMAIKDGIEKIKVLLQGKTLDEANMQLEGSNRKIAQLVAEIERSRRSTIVEAIPDDPVKIYEFNNHLFTNKTVPQGTLCDFCNEVLYGVVNQGFECRDCKMTVHKSCYVLGDVSCELYSALKTGKTYYVTMRTLEEKEKLLKAYSGY